jgi:hypothetical protein
VRIIVTFRGGSINKRCTAWLEVSDFSDENCHNAEKWIFFPTAVGFINDLAAVGARLAGHGSADSVACEVPKAELLARIHAGLGKVGY